jgi:hypothetical protein
MSGKVLQAVTGPDAFPLAARGLCDVRTAAATALRGFLECLVFVRWSEVGATEFALTVVREEWPNPEVPLEYPSASIIDAGDEVYSEHALVPTCLEETRDVFCPNTVAWKTSEAELRFQVDFWANEIPTRDAIAARIAEAFNPTEGRSGVMLAGTARYYNAPIRATLINVRRMDTPDAVYSHERRLMALVRCEADVIQLRQAVALDARIRID